MPYSVPLQLEADLQGFFIQSHPNRPNSPEVVINENLPRGLYDTVIKDSQAWDVTFYWRIDGDTANAMGPFNWVLNVYLLRLSPPAGVWQASKVVPFKVGDPVPDDYAESINIPAYKDDPAHGVPTGLYDFHASIDIQSQAVVPVTLMGDGPMMKFYKPG